MAEVLLGVLGARDGGGDLHLERRGVLRRLGQLAVLLFQLRQRRRRLILPVRDGLLGVLRLFHQLGNHARFFLEFPRLLFDLEVVRLLSGGHGGYLVQRLVGSTKVLLRSLGARHRRLQRLRRNLRRLLRVTLHLHLDAFGRGHARLRRLQRLRHSRRDFILGGFRRRRAPRRFLRRLGASVAKRRQLRLKRVDRLRVRSQVLVLLAVLDRQVVHLLQELRLVHQLLRGERLLLESGVARLLGGANLLLRLGQRGVGNRRLVLGERRARRLLKLGGGLEKRRGFARHGVRLGASVRRCRRRRLLDALGESRLETLLGIRSRRAQRRRVRRGLLLGHIERLLDALQLESRVGSVLEATFRLRLRALRRLLKRRHLLFERRDCRLRRLEPRQFIFQTRLSTIEIVAKGGGLRAYAVELALAFGDDHGGGVLRILRLGGEARRFRRRVPQSARGSLALLRELSLERLPARHRLVQKVGKRRHAQLQRTNGRGELHHLVTGASLSARGGGAGGFRSKGRQAADGIRRRRCALVGAGHAVALELSVRVHLGLG